MKKPSGWDSRDALLWSAISTLPSYGLIAPDGKMISEKAVLQLLEKAAKDRDNERRK